MTGIDIILECEKEEARARAEEHAQRVRVAMAAEERDRAARQPWSKERLAAEQRELSAENEADPPCIDVIDKELDALRECAIQLEQLDVDARQRVLAWLANRYGGGRR